MPLTAEVHSAVSLLESLQGSLRGCEEPRLGVQYTNDLNTLISVLHNPVLNKIIAIQDSIHDLKKELARHPSLLPSDFDISPRRGELTLHFPSDGVDEGLGGEIYPKKKSSKSPVEIVQGVPLDLIDVDQSVHNSYETHPLGDSEPPSPQRQWLKNGRGPDEDSDEDLGVNEGEEGESEGIINQSNATLDTELRQLIRVAAEGRQIHHIQLYKPEGTSLGFSVVGLKSEQRGDLGIYVQEIQSTGIAAKDGRLRDGDQILAIDGQVLDTYISHQQAISILQKANKLVDLVVARAPAIESIAQPLIEDDHVAEEEHFKLRQESIRRQKLLVEQQQLESSLLREREQLFLQQQYTTTTHIVPPSTESRTSNMLNTEWAQVEVIHLVNDGSGLGFGIIGGRSTGVVVKTILPGGVADREGRLQSGDHILQIGEVNLRGMGSDQVASVLRQAGSHVRLVVARPVESASPDFQIGRTAPIVETRVLNDPEELDRHLNLISNGFPSSSIALSSIAGGNGGPASSSTSSASTVPAGLPTNGHSDYLNGDSELLTVNNQIASTSAAVAVVASDGHLISAGGSYLPMEVISPCDENTVVEGGEGMSLADLPEMENIDLDLAKDHQGLGITIAGYVCEREELSGIFVKSINAGSAADRSGHVRVNDQIVEVDGKSLTGLSNHAAVEVLRSTGQRVRLRLARYLRGPKFEQLQQAIANSELKTTPSTPNPPRAPHGEVPSSEALRTALGELEAEDQNRSNESLVEAYNPAVGPAVPLHPAVTQQASIVSIKDSYDESCSRIITTSSDVLQGSSRPPSEVRLDDIELLIDSDFSGELSSPVESAIIRKWSRIVGLDMEIVVAQLKKFERGGGLGISLEGTVDVEDGREVRPHHYIRSILPDGPVGRDNRLKSGDEFLEVNNQKLLGLNHVEVVTILKELPQAVRIVCGRRVSGSGTPIHSGDAVAHREAFGARNVLGGSLQSLVPSSERLVKAKSDGSLASSTTNANSDSGNSFTKVKSRSLEPLTGLAMWSTDPQHIELIKGERGLGFSILDYQDPMNPQETVIVIRSLVPGGVAEKDGRLIPGDRLVGVNGTSLEKASLDEAVAELKGAPKGPVIISVAKPISVLESPGQLDLILGDLGSSEAGSDATEDVADWNHEDDYTHEQIEERRKRRKTNDSVISTSSVPPALPVTEPPMLDRDASVLMVPVATERLIGGSSSSSASNSAGGELFKGGGEGGRPPPHSESQTMFLSSSASPPAPVVAPSSGEEDLSPHGSPKPHPRIHSLAHSLPRHLERVIKVRKGGDQLGINIEVVDQGINGVVVSSLVRGGAVYKDGRVRAGDLIVSVNNETTRNITNSQARAILRRTQLVSTDVCIAFIPGEEAAKHRENRLQTYKPEITEPQPHERLNQRLVYASRESSEEEVLGIPSSDLTRSSTAPSFVTRQLTRSRDPSQEETLETHTAELLPSPVEAQFVEARPSSSLSDVSGAAATVVTLKNAISEVLGTEERSRPSQKSGREDTEEEPFTITFRNVTEAGVVRGDLQPHAEEVLHAPSGMSEASAEARNNNSTTPPAMDGKHWGPERIVEVKRDENGSLGISIVGGKVDISWSGSSVTGIFVKNVLANSPAGRSGLLKTGDRILEVEGVDLRTATHEKAVEVIKKTGNPVTFVVQSLVQWNTPSTPVSRETSRLGIHAPEAVPPARTPTPELIQPGLSDQKKQELQEKILEKEQQMKDALRGNHDEDEDETSEDDEDTRILQGRTTTTKGVEIDRASAGAMKRSKAEKTADLEDEDNFGYTNKKVQKKYSSPDGEVHLVDLLKGNCGLGISLAGHKDRTQMSVYVCGMNPNGNAFKDGRIQVGDEILEVNGYVVEGRSHLNASTIFKGIPGPSIKIIIRRRKTGLQDMAVKPLTHFPITLEDESPEEKYARFKGLTKFVMKKGQFGLGIMIIEGKHAEYGNGIFISDLQEGSTASEAGLMVGDMILSVNKEEMIGVDYEMAASILKKTEGVITMWVANAARVTGSITTSSTDGIPAKIASPLPAKNAEPKKPEIPPKPSILPKPPIPAKPFSIHASQTASSAATLNPISSQLNPPTSLPHQPNPLPAEGNSTTRSPSSLSTALHSPGTLRTTMGTSAPPSEEPPADPSSAEIKPGRETTIEIIKEKMGLGLSIVGGTDTLLGAIIIHEVYPDGAAAKDGRLKPGDQILEVNSEDFRVITHQKALSVLRQTPSKVKMVVYREEGTQKEEDLYDVISVQLTKKSGKGLGLSIVGRKNGPGVFISDLVPGGVAESDGRMMQGDQILEVNDKDLRTASQEQAAAILKCAPASVSMKIGRLKPGKKVSPSLTPTWPMTISEGPPRTPSSLSPEFPFPHPPLLISPHTIPQLQSSSSSSPLTTPQTPPPNTVSSVPPNSPLRTVILERGDDGLGFSIVGGFGSNLGDLPIYVKSVFDRGAAAREGSLRRGDQILQVNGHSLAGLTHAQAVGILKDAKGTVTLTILPSK